MESTFFPGLPGAHIGTVVIDTHQTKRMDFWCCRVAMVPNGTWLPIIVNMLFTDRGGAYQTTIRRRTYGEFWILKELIGLLFIPRHIDPWFWDCESDTEVKHAKHEHLFAYCMRSYLELYAFNRAIHSSSHRPLPPLILGLWVRHWSKTREAWAFICLVHEVISWIIRLQIMTQ